MAKHALIQNNTTGILRYGFQDFTTDQDYNAGTMTQVNIADEAAAPDDVLIKYCKVVALLIVEMTPAEKIIVDNLTPTAAVQRKIVDPETVIATGGADAVTGWASVIGGVVTTKPLIASDYQLAVAFELSLVAAAVWGAGGPDRAAQARLLMNGAEIATWVEPMHVYSRMGVTLGDVFARGTVLTFDLQIRRFGTAGSARARRIRLELAPTVSAQAL